MKQYTSNYQDTLILVAEDCPAMEGTVPPQKKGDKSIAELQYELIHAHPYKYTSDDVLFQVYAQRNDLSKSEWKTARELFLSKGQACFRASPLTKRYGWGVHSNTEGRIALYGCETAEYHTLEKDKKTQTTRAMRSKR